jgi:hypothetical protein
MAQAPVSHCRLNVDNGDFRNQFERDFIPVHGNKKRKAIGALEAEVSEWP